MMSPCDDAFVEALASSSPTPGGGGASAYVGAIAAALSSMVGNLTIGKKRYADVEDEVMASLGSLSVLTARLLTLVEEDADAFEPLAAAYRMPHTTEQEIRERESVLQSALKGACDAPLGIMRACLEVLHECDTMAHLGSRMAISDAGASALLAQAALRAAALNVYINIGSMKDTVIADALRGEADALIESAQRLADGICSFVAGSMGAR